MKKRFKGRFIFSNRWLDRHQIVRNMEAFQDVIVIFLCLGLFAVMVIQLLEMFGSLIQPEPVDFQKVTAKILFLLILVELFRLLVIYLQEHSVSVGVAVEVTIVSVLREVIVHGALEISWVQVLALCGLLFVLGGLLMVCARTPHMDHINGPVMYKPHNHREQESDLPHSNHYEGKV
jgi:uncharacterized membrane protein (DUF373 family)